MTIKLSKSRPSIREIGFIRFYVGIFSGLGFAIAWFLLFQSFREIMRWALSENSPILLLNKEEAFFHNAFNASLSFSLGISLTIFIWFHTVKKPWVIRNHFKRLIATMAFFTFWVFAYLLSKLGFIYGILISTIGFDPEVLNFYRDHKFLLILIPTVIFGNAWMAFRLEYQGVKWQLISLVAGVVYTTVMVTFFGASPEMINNRYAIAFPEKMNTVHHLLDSAESKYNINFEQETKDVLVHWYSLKHVALTEKVYDAFDSPKPVSLDTIMLARILVESKTDNISQVYLYTWRFPHPQDIFFQIKRHKARSIETAELLNLYEYYVELNSKEVEQTDSPPPYYFSSFPQSYTFFPQRLRRELFDFHVQLVQDYPQLNKETVTITESDFELLSSPPPGYKSRADFIRKYVQDSLRGSK